MQALEQVGLKGWEDSMTSQLSGGMQQRVGLARALALDPDIMLMDEAFSALDPLIRRDMQNELLALQEEVKKTIVFISHDLDEALKIGDRIILMKDGFIIQEGTAEQILTHPANDYVAKFVEDVDMAKVLTAESVMVDFIDMAHAKTDGPRAVLRKMRNLKTSSIFVEKDRKLEGIVFASDASEALNRGDKNLNAIIKKDIPTVSPDTVANELFGLLAEINYPLAVVGHRHHLKGIVVKGALLGALSENIQA
jgi:glycine betaine/proline transport system ATP-binding protein